MQVMPEYMMKRVSDRAHTNEISTNGHDRVSVVPLSRTRVYSNNIIRCD